MIELKNSVKVSVIIPVYNTANYLEQCVDSILEQTLDDIEIILVDDGSTDGSIIICDNYAEKYPNIKVIHKNNGGQGSARNIGIEIASGEYLYFIDSDDWLSRNALYNLYDIAHNNDLDIVLFSSYVVYENSKTIENITEDAYERRFFVGQVCEGWKSVEEEIRLGEYNVSICMRLYKSEFLKKNEYVFNEEYIHEDEDVAFLSHLCATRVMAVEDKYYYRRVREGSTMTSRSALNSARGYNYAWKQILQYALNSKNTIHKQICYDRCRIYLYICLDIYTDATGIERKKIKPLCKQMLKMHSRIDKSKTYKVGSYSVNAYFIVCRLKELLKKNEI